MVDIADALIAGQPIPTEVISIRPGEKTHEILISEEEAARTSARHGHFVLQSILPEVSQPLEGPPLTKESEFGRLADGFGEAFADCW